MEIIIKFMKEKKREFILTVIMASIGSILSIIPFALIYKIISMFLNKGLEVDINNIIVLLIIALSVIVIKYAFVVTSFVFSHIAAFDLLYIIRSRLTSHLGKLPLGFWSKNSSGKIRKIIQEDVERIELFVAHHLPDTVSGFVLPIATIVYLSFIHWQMALVTLIPLPLGLIMIKLMFSGIAMQGSNRKELWQKYHKSIENMHATIVEFVEGMPVVKAFNITAHSFERLKSAIMIYRDFTVKMSKTQTPFYAVFTAMTIGGGLFIIPFGLHFMRTGSLELSTFLLFLTLGTGCFHQFVKVMMITGHMELIFAGGERIASILNEMPMIEPQQPSFPEKYDIEMKSVNFKYDQKGNDILKNVNLSFPERSLTAIVGHSGSGKSTIVNLISRMWDVQSGEICIGGLNLKNIGMNGINQLVGTVFQDVRILTDTVENNIKMNNKNASRSEIIEAAKVANCHEFIMKLPKNYATVIGDGGEIHLSGGEKQRISIARVVLKKAKIVLLDEASCYSDADNEVKIQDAFSKIMQDKTVIVIAHRLSTIVGADNIVVVDNGQISGQGKHDELLKTNSVYSKMWSVHNRANDWKIAEEDNGEKK